MEFFDIVFPLNLGPLTYRCPEGLSDIVEPGMVVSAPLKGKTRKGIIAGRSLKAPTADVKDIQKVHGNTPVLNTKMITLLRWISEYYMAEQGLVLKNMLPKEAFTELKQKKIHTVRKAETSAEGCLDYASDIIDSKMLDTLTDSILKQTYITFLIHAPSSVYEYLFLLRILEGIKNAIILVPEVSLINNLYPDLNKRFGERLCLFHSGLSRSKRSETIEGILSGRYDIVLGTRSAVFAPLKKVSFIAVLHEHSDFYKQKGGLCYNGRDIAVMRGYIEGVTVLLSSHCPSIESLYNCKKGKYTLLTPKTDVKRPKVRIVDMRNEKLLGSYLAKRVVDASLRYVKGNNKVMFVMNRRGYSTLLQCAECSYIEECPDCKIPLIFHKQGMSMRCHYCGYISNLHDKCSRCKGYNVKLLGAGTQRLEEDIEKLIGIKTLRFDSDRARKSSEIERLIKLIRDDEGRIIIGTKLMTKRLGITGGFSMAAILNIDLLLNLPDFRSTEKAFQEISSVIDKVKPNGEIFIQTMMPENYLFKYLREYNYASFFREELHRRKSLLYPPYSKLLLLKFISKRDISEKLSGIIEKIDKDVKILGPSISKRNTQRHVFRILLKSSNREDLHSVAKTFIEVLKDSKGIKIKVDVDPISI